jgi:two-component system, NarL family, invasion response regulator UvrY
MNRNSADLIKLLLVEDHPIVRDACRRICHRRADVKICEAATAEEALANNRRFRPNIIILDLNLGSANGFDIMNKLASDNPDVGLIVFSGYDDAQFVTRALDLGARGYVTKNDDPSDILTAIDKVNAGAFFLSPSAAQTLAIAALEGESDGLRELTEREKQIMHFLGDGKDLSELAALSGIGYKTAANCVASLKRKLGVQTTSALIKYAVERRTKTAARSPAPCVER